MTKEEAKEQLIWYFDNDDGLGADLKTRQAYMKAIEALEQKPILDKNGATNGKMTRIEENKIVIEAVNETAKRKPTGTYEEMVVFQLGAISTLLGDISRSLAIIADKSESEDKND